MQWSTLGINSTDSRSLELELESFFGAAFGSHAGGIRNPSVWKLTPGTGQSRGVSCCRRPAGGATSGRASCSRTRWRHDGATAETRHLWANVLMTSLRQTAGVFKDMFNSRQINNLNYLLSHRQTLSVSTFPPPDQDLIMLFFGPLHSNIFSQKRHLMAQILQQDHFTNVRVRFSGGYGGVLGPL